MAEWLPLFFVFAMSMALFIYVILDGYDLGIGMLFPLATENEKDQMIAAIGPFWDANETWLVLGIGILLIAFPQAYGIILSEMYIPVTAMLFGIILRGAAFDFRFKVNSDKKKIWNFLFFAGSSLTTISQGWMVGHYITGMDDAGQSPVFTLLIAATLPALYILLGTSWLLIKGEQELFQKAISWGRLAILPMGLALLLVSIATPTVSPLIAEKWFTLPNVIGLLPIPLISLLAYSMVIWLLFNPKLLQSGYAWIPYTVLIVICLMATICLAYSFYPFIILGKMTIWDAAASTESLQFTFVGTAVILPLIGGYTIFVYRVFKGKIGSLEY